MKAKIARVGWENENPAVPIILMDLSMRNLGQFQLADIVKVKHGENIAIAVVERQFLDLCGQGKFTVNQKLSGLLDCIEEDTIEIVGKASEAEITEFQRQAQQEMGRHMAAELANALNHGLHNSANSEDEDGF